MTDRAREGTPPIIHVTDPAFHRPSYEQGYRDGESSMHADYTAVLDEITEFDWFTWPENLGFYPTEVGALIRRLLEVIQRKDDELNKIGEEIARIASPSA